MSTKRRCDVLENMTKSFLRVLQESTPTAGNGQKGDVNEEDVLIERIFSDSDVSGMAPVYDNIKDLN